MVGFCWMVVQLFWGFKLPVALVICSVQRSRGLVHPGFKRNLVLKIISDTIGFEILGGLIAS